MARLNMGPTPAPSSAWIHAAPACAGDTQCADSICAHFLVLHVTRYCRCIHGHADVELQDHDRHSSMHGPTAFRCLWGRDRASKQPLVVPHLEVYSDGWTDGPTHQLAHSYRCTAIDSSEPRGPFDALLSNIGVPGVDCCLFRRSHSALLVCLRRRDVPSGA